MGTLQTFWFWVAIGVAVLVIWQAAVWLYKAIRSAVAAKKERDARVRDFSIHLFNLVSNCENWLDPSAKNVFPLVHPNGMVSQQTQGRIREYVVKCQKFLMSDMLSLNGLMSFSRRQRDLLHEINGRLSSFCSSSLRVGGIVGGSMGVAPIDAEGEVIDMRHVRRDFERLKAISLEDGTYWLGKRLSIKYRFFPKGMKFEDGLVYKPPVLTEEQRKKIKVVEIFDTAST